MLREPEVDHREFPIKRLICDLAVIGGGMAGVCCAITAAREGISVVLVQDRPVLGGNASSEVRLWVLGATAHMSNNNRWAREGGVIDEILVENTWRNPEGNPLIFDTIVLEKVVEEPGITLLLNTALVDAQKDGADIVRSVRAFCSQSSTMYDISAPLFCDASGDGALGFLAGAAFRMGAEPSSEFGEKFAPSADYGELLGHSMYFYSKDAGRPVKFVPPSFAMKDIPGRIPRYRSFNSSTYGCRLWWIEWGGRLDTVHATEDIKWELWRVVYGVWDYIKNSGSFPDAENLTLEWVGTIPGKRESRRFEGDYMLMQQDIVEQREFPDAVSFGGWSIDLHPADGVFSERPGCNQWHSRGIYEIPYRCLYSRNIRNLFLAGRIISASHVAFGSSRVMATCANSAQAAGVAAAMCRADGLLPRDIAKPEHIKRLQQRLICTGQHIPGVTLSDPDDLARSARITASSELKLASLPDDGPTLRLDHPRGQLVPLPAGPVPAFAFTVDADQDATVTAELRASLKPKNHSPDAVLESISRDVKAGRGQKVTFPFETVLEEARYVFVCLGANKALSVHCSNARVTGMVSVVRRRMQAPESDIGVDTFELWTPDRRPGGHNLAFACDPPIGLFGAANVMNGVARPTTGPNAWIPDLTDWAPWLKLEWGSAQRISRVDLSFDTDFDHPMESVLMGQPEATMPSCVRSLRVLDERGQVAAEISGNHQTRRTVVFREPVPTSSLTIDGLTAGDDTAPAVFEVRVYSGGAADGG